MKASDLFVKALENEGVRFVFGIPGEENLDLLESLRKSKIQLILTRHEQAAGFMAATYGRLTGKPGVCLSTLGPGATNLVTSAAYAQLGAMPLVVITGQKPIRKSKQGMFQIVDVVEMFRPITKSAKQIVDGARIPALVREAFRLAEEERPGAVHLELPEDIAQEEVDMPLFQPSKARRAAGDLEAIKTAVEMIQNAKVAFAFHGRWRKPQTYIGRPERVRREDGHSLFHHPDGHRCARQQPRALTGNGRALGPRIRASCCRQSGCDHQRRA